MFFPLSFSAVCAFRGRPGLRFAGVSMIAHDTRAIKNRKIEPLLIMRYHVDTMGKIQVKKVTVPACGAGCDLCAADLDISEVATIRNTRTVHRDVSPVKPRPVDRAAVALERQDRVFAE